MQTIYHYVWLITLSMINYNLGFNQSSYLLVNNKPYNYFYLKSIIS